MSMLLGQGLCHLIVALGSAKELISMIRAH
jgi:hypothetical protein